MRNRRERGAAIDDSKSYNILVLYHREREDSLVTMLREKGHSVRSVDSQNAPSQDLTKVPLQHSILDSIPDADFVYMCAHRAPHRMLLKVHRCALTPTTLEACQDSPADGFSS